MKTYKLIALCLAGLFFGACEDGLDEEVGLQVSVATNENTSYDGQIVTVKKGTPVQFLLSGDPDFISFFSGEEGYKYQYRERSSIDPSQLEKVSLDFSINLQYGNINGTERHVYISDEFPGLSKDNFENDSILVEQFETDGRWKEIVNEYPAISKTQSYSIDVSEYIGKKVTLAICYRGLKNNAAQSTFRFDQMCFTDVMKNGQTTQYSAGSFGFVPLNMKNKWNLSDQAKMKGDPEYGSEAGISGIWNLDNVGTGTLILQSSSIGSGLKYSWLVSDPIAVNSCTPDQGTKIKDITQSLDSYTHTYKEIGIYNATFLARNANIDHASTVTRNLVINVVE